MRDRGSNPASIPALLTTRPRALLQLTLLSTPICSLSMATVQLSVLSTATLGGLTTPPTASVSINVGTDSLLSYPTVLSGVRSSVLGLTGFPPKISREFGLFVFGRASEKASLVSPLVADGWIPTTRDESSFFESTVWDTEHWNEMKNRETLVKIKQIKKQFNNLQCHTLPLGGSIEVFSATHVCNQILLCSF